MEGRGRDPPGRKWVGPVPFGRAEGRTVAAQRYVARPAVLSGMGLVLFFAVLRLLGFVARFRSGSLQMDFSAFYTAGQALNAGVSPYRTNVALRIWDGVDTYLHSRFLYPPLVATLFRPLAAVPYYDAKLIWMLFSLGCLAVAIVAVLDYVPRPWRLEAGLAAGIATALLFPLLTLLERGQIDAVTLALLALGIRLLRTDVPRRRLLAGLFFALATLLKLNVGFVFPFLLLRRSWRAALGFGLGGVVLVGATLALNGPAALSAYLRREMPRIERYGEGGPGGALTPADITVLEGGAVGAGHTRKDGRVYPDAYFGFSANATLVRVEAVARRFRRANTPSKLSLRLLEISLLAMILVELVLSLRRVRLSDPEVLAYWTAVLMIVLLTGPFTWVMNVVWMAVVPVVVWAQAQRLRSPLQGVFLGVAALGFVLAAVPDSGSFALLNPFSRHWVELVAGNSKYVVAELIVLAAMLGVVLSAPSTKAAPPGDGTAA
jgi:hypothetical protein